MPGQFLLQRLPGRFHVPSHGPLVLFSQGVVGEGGFVRQSPGVVAFGRAVADEAQQLPVPIEHGGPAVPLEHPPHAGIAHLFAEPDVQKSERRQQDAGTLSGGEQQMLAICRALMGRPRLLMLDEPSLGLAPVIVNEVFETIQRIRDEGVTVILVEQNAKKSLSIADRAYVIENGCVVMSGPGQSLLEDPQVAAAYLGSGRK